MAHEFGIGLEELDDAEWFLCTPGVLNEHALLASAIAEFEAAAETNPEAADEATKWLQEDAARQQAAVTRLMVARGHLVGFYALVSAEMEISATQNLQDLGYHRRFGPPGRERIGSSHIEVVARDRRAPSGAGKYLLKHAFGIAALTDSLQGNRALTLDPRDSLTQEMWLKQGFRRTDTAAWNGPTSASGQTRKTSGPNDLGPPPAAAPSKPRRRRQGSGPCCPGAPQRSRLR
jgi:hypothetical protein